MPKIKRSSIDDVRARVSLYDVVAPYVTLKKAGAKWKGLSPFANEKTPSFYVDPGKNLYYCFSTGQGGDIFKFVQTKENLGFQEAVEALAQRFSIALEYEEGAPGAHEARSLRKELFDLHEAATAQFHAAFLHNDDGGAFIRKYWTESRRFTLDLAKEFKIGWAGTDGGGLLEALLKTKKFSAEAFFACGLFFYREGERDPARGRPRFRGRLMIPIRDVQGRVIAFTARQTERTPADDPSREAKYVNSPETPLFRKGDVLFNLDRAHAPVREAGRFVMVEGQLDALRCWSVGLTSAVAPQGTAITENQFLLLRRYAGRVDCLLDGDAAGQRAAMRALPLALKAGIEIRFLPLAADEDPDEIFLEKGAAALTALDKNSLSAMAFAVKSLLPTPNASAREKGEALRALFEILEQTDSAMLRADYLAEACKYAGMDRTGTERDFARFLAERSRRATLSQTLERIGYNPASSSENSKENPNDKLTTAEYELLMVVLHHEDLAPAIAHAIDHQWLDTRKLEGLLLDRCLAAHREDAWPGLDHLDDLLETDEERQLISSLRSRPFQTDEPFAAANQCIKAIFETYFRRELTELKTRIANTATSDATTLADIHHRIKEVQKLLRQPPQLPL
ncbi:MAG TPA: DNA primase [Opitutales bacterium]|nr:DNA primase [Opitutales bacterium]